MLDFLTLDLIGVRDFLETLFYMWLILLFFNFLVVRGFSFNPLVICQSLVTQPEVKTILQYRTFELNSNESFKLIRERNPKLSDQEINLLLEGDLYENV